MLIHGSEKIHVEPSSHFFDKKMKEEAHVQEVPLNKLHS